MRSGTDLARILSPLLTRAHENGGRQAVWEYDDRAAYEQIDAAVRSDPDSGTAARRRAELPPLSKAADEVFMTSTVNFPRAGLRTNLANSGRLLRLAHHH